MKAHRVLCSLAMALCLACSSSSDDDGPSPGGRGGAGGKGGATGGKGGGGSGGQATGGKGGSGGSTMVGTGGSSSGTGGTMVSGSAPKDGLVGYWGLDDGTGVNAKDGSGLGNDGALVEGVQDSSPSMMAPKWIEGKKGKALEFDGVDDWVRVPRSDSLDSTGTEGKVSIAAWVRFTAYQQPAANSQFNFVVSRQEVGTPYEHYGLALREGAPTAAVHFFFATAPQVIVVNEWTHLAMTYDGIDMSIYVNGKLATAASIGWPISADTTPLTIGAAQNINVIKEFVQGNVDEIYLYNRALQETEIQSLMNAM